MDSLFIKSDFNQKKEEQKRRGGGVFGKSFLFFFFLLSIFTIFSFNFEKNLFQTHNENNNRRSKIIRRSISSNDQKLNDLWKKVQPGLASRRSRQPLVTFNNQNYFINKLWDEKTNTGPGSNLPSAAKAQLQKLVNNNITWNQIKSEIDKWTRIGENFQNSTKWDELKTEFASYSGFKSDSVIINSKTYTLTALWSKLLINQNGYNFKGNARSQLLALADDKITREQIKIALDTADNNRKLDILWNAIQPLLSGYSNLAPDSIIFNNQSYNIDQLFAQKTHDVNSGSTILNSGNPSARSQLQALLNAGMTTDSQMQTALNVANNKKLNDLWKIVQPGLYSYPITLREVPIPNIGLVKIGKLWDEKQIKRVNQLSPEAIAQLQTLVNKKITWDQIKSQLDRAKEVYENLNNDKKWETLKPQLSTYSGFKFTSIKIGSKTYTLTALWPKLLIDEDGYNFKGNARSQLLALTQNNITWDQIKTELDKLNNQKLNDLWSTIQPLLNNYKNLSPALIPFNNKDYNISQLFVQKTKTNAGSTLPDNVKNQLQVLVNAQMTTSLQMTTALTNANTALLISLWTTIQDELIAYPGTSFNTSITVQNKGSFIINHLLDEKKDNFKQLSTEAVAQLQLLLNAKIANGELGTVLTTRNNTALNNLWDAIQPVLDGYTDLVPDSITYGSQQTLGVKQLFAQKGHDQKSGSTISDTNDPSARDQLQALVNAGMNTRNEMQAALVKTAFLTDLWTKIQDELIAYPGVVFNEQIPVLQTGSNTPRGDFTINYLLRAKNNNFNQLSDDAKVQLQALFNANVVDSELETALTKHNNDKLDNLWSTIQPVLNSQPIFSPPSISYGSQSSLNIDQLFAQKTNTNDGSKLPNEAKTQLQALLNAGMTTDPQMQTALTNANTAFWTTIQNKLQVYPGTSFSTPIRVFESGTSTSRGDFTINYLLDDKNDELAVLSVEAKNQLQKLLNAKVTDDELETALTTHNNNALSTLWTTIQGELQSYPGIVFDTEIRVLQASTSTARGTFTINHLLTEKNNNFNVLLPNSRTQLQKLLNAKVTDKELETALTTHNNNALSTLWTTIQDELQAYPGTIFKEQITVASKGTFTINHLLTEKNNNFNVLLPNSRTQLQKLLNAKVTDKELETALTNHNNNKLNALWNAIQPLLSGYSNLAPDSIPFNNQNYNIDQLFAQKDHNQNSGSTILNSGNPSARSQLQTLVNAGMTTDSQMQTALDAANNKKLDNLWKIVQPGLYSYPIIFRLVSIPDKNSINQFFDIGKLWDEKTNTGPGSNLPSGAKVQLQTLVNKQITWDQIKTALDSLTKHLEDFKNNQKWKTLKPQLSTYSGFKFTSIKIDSKTYTLTALWPKLLINEDGYDFKGNARSQLLVLVQNNITWNQIKLALNTANNNRNLDILWNAIQPLLSGYLNLAPNSIPFNNQNYNIDKLFAQKNHDQNSGSTISNDGTPSALSQLQTLLNAGMTIQTQMQDALTNANTALLTDLWTKIKGELQSYPGVIFTTPITVASKGRFTINHLLSKKTAAFADLSSDAIDQLQKLLNAKVSSNDVVTGVNNSALNAFWSTIQPYLKNYQNFPPVSIIFNNQKYNVDQLFAQKNHNQNSGSTISDTDVDGSSSRSQLQALVNAKMTLQTQMQTALADANTALLTSLWTTIQDELQTYPGSIFTTQIVVASKGSFSIDHLLSGKNNNFNQLSTDAITQLQALLNANVADGEVGTALTLRNIIFLNDLWSDIQPLLKNYKNFPPNPITFNGKNHNIDQLFAQKNHNQNSGFTISDSGNPSARDQLQALVNAGMTIQTQMQDALTNANNALLTTLWGQIQDELIAYPGTSFSTPITVFESGKTTSRGAFSINHLLDEKNNNFNQLSDDAKSQLQPLLNKGVANGEVGTALTLRNIIFLNDLWKDIQPLLSGYLNLAPNSIPFNNQNHNIDQLFAQKNHNQNSGFTISDSGNPSALSQLQALVNAGMTIQTQMQDALTNANTSLLTTLWGQIQGEFQNYPGTVITDQIAVLQAGSSNSRGDFTINHLLREKNNAFADLSPEAITQLQALLNAKVVSGEIGTTLTTRNDNALNVLWVALKTALASYTGYNFENVDVEVGGNNYKLNLLIDNKTDQATGSTLTNLKGQTQLQKLVNGGITDANAVRTALDAANKQKLDTLWTAIWQLLNDYPNLTPISVLFNSKVLLIDQLFVQKNHDVNSGSTISNSGNPSARSQLQALVNAGMITGPQMTTALTNTNTALLTNLWNTIQDELIAYPGIAFSTPITVLQTGSTASRGTFTINHLLTEKNSEFNDLSDDAKTQLQLLLNAGIANGELGTVLTTRNTSFLNDLWVDIQPLLRNYNNLPLISVSFNGQNYDIDQLFAQKEHDRISGSTISSTGVSNAKTQLQALLNAGMTTQTQMQTALTDANTALLTDLWTKIKDELTAYPGIAFSTPITVLQTGSTASRGTFTINHLLNEKGREFADLSDEAKAQLQVLLNAKVIDAELGTALTLRNTNALNALWTAIQPLLSNYSNLAPDSIPFNNQNYDINQLFSEKTNANAGSTLPDNAKTQLQTLVNAQMTTDSQMQTALTNANTALLTTFWEQIQNEFQDYKGSVFTNEIVVLHLDGSGSRGAFTLNHLLTEKSDNFNQLSPEAIAQLQLLFNAQVANGELAEVLTLRNDNKLDTLWRNIQPHLSSYSNYFPNLITIPIGETTKTYSIDQLFAQKDHNQDSGSTIPDTDVDDSSARSQLQVLVNDKIIFTQIQTALTHANTALLNAFWGEIQDELQTYPGNVFDTEIAVLESRTTTSRGTFTINHLLSEKNNSFNQLSPEAIVQLQTLLNAKVTNAELGTALTLRNNNALNDLWTVIQPLLRDYQNLSPTSITYNSQEFTIDQLFAQKTNTNEGSTIPDDAIAQLQELLNAGITNDELATTLTTRNNQRLDNLWTAIKTIFPKDDYSTANHNKIIVRNKVYDFKILSFHTQTIRSRNTPGSALEDDAKAQLQTLVNGVVTAKDIETYLEEVKQQKRKEDLTIVLGTTGAIIGLTVVTGGFAYWFVKTRHS